MKRSGTGWRNDRIHYVGANECESLVFLCFLADGLLWLVLGLELDKETQVLGILDHVPLELVCTLSQSLLR